VATTSCVKVWFWF